MGMKQTTHDGTTYDLKTTDVLTAKTKTAKPGLNVSASLANGIVLEKLVSHKSSTNPTYGDRIQHLDQSRYTYPQVAGESKTFQVNVTLNLPDDLGSITQSDLLKAIDEVTSHIKNNIVGVLLNQIE
jgi:hypothetical protein